MMLRLLLRHPVLRRTCTFGVLAVLCAVALVLLPLAALIGLLSGRRRRATRFAAFAAAYLGAEISGLWGAARLDRHDLDAHYALLRRLLDRLFRCATKRFRLEVLPPETGLELPDGPLLVFSRHAGPGDSFLLVYALLAAAERRPRVVLTERLTFDPLVDVLLHRTPNCFVPMDAKRREATGAEIGELAGSLSPQDALLLFPEGRNFTTARRSRLISRLRSKHAWRILPVARSLEHVLPARPAGVFTAVDAAPPGSSILFLAHTGLDRLETTAQVWRAIPLDQPVQAAWRTVPVEQVPRDAEEREQWLAAEWARIDEWIDRRAPQEEPQQEPELQEPDELGSSLNPGNNGGGELGIEPAKLPVEPQQQQSGGAAR